MKKTLLFLVSCVMTTLVWADTTTFDFANASTFSTDWDVNAVVPSGGTGKCEHVSSLQSFPTTSGDFMGFSFMNKSGITITVTSKASFKDISNLSFNAVASDNSKPSWTVNIVDDAGTVLVALLSAVDSKNTFKTGGTNKWGSWSGAVSPTKTGHIQFVLTASSSGKYAGLDNIVITHAAAGPSSDATLKALTVDGAGIAGFAANLTSYNVELAADYTGTPTVAATPTDSKAKADVTQATAVPGTATINVTAEDGTSKKEYKITFTKASSKPKVETATWDNITAAGATVDNVKMNITGKIKYGTGLTAITPSFTGKNIASWTPNTPQDFSKGAVDYTLSSSTGETTVYHVAITEADPLSSNAFLSSIKVNGTQIANFNKNTLSYSADWASGTPQPTVTYTTEDSKATVTPNVGTGVVTLVVTAEDLSTKTYTITFVKVVPPSDLAIHIPDIFDQPKEAGGYNARLTVYNNREYEVYYSGRDDASNCAVQTTPVDKTPGITKNSTSNSFRAIDDWFKGSIGSIKGTETAATEEFSTGSGRTYVVNGTSQYIELHIKGFDQFSLLGYDKKCSDPNKPDQWQILTVSIDGDIQPMTPAHQTWTVRRFDISSGEHVIRISGSGSGDNQVGGWSLRVGTDPRVRYVMGNDSSQSILQTRKMSPVTYIVKNNVDTKVVWTSGTPATGIDLVKHGHSGVSDTLMLEGNANCPVGTYTYRIVAYDASGNEKSAVEKGSFSVRSQLNAITDTIVNAYEGWSMDAIEYTYYALDANQIHLTWTSGTPAGITGAGKDGTYSISGTPTAQGTYPFTISIDGGNTLTGKLIVKHLDLGTDPILYVYKGTIEKDGIFDYLESKNSVMAATQSSVSNMSADQMNKFKVIVIGESTDATNEGAKGLIRHSTIPVLNMQIFAYNPSRLDWGYAANGSAVTAKMKVVQPTHPIFKKMGLTANQEIELLDTVETKGLVAAEVYHEGSWCLSTTAMRGEDYLSDGDQQTFLHEVSAAEHGSKYLCLPIAKASSNHLTTQGKRLIDECIAYLKDNGASPIALPKLQITSFSINGVNGVIDEANKTITVTINKEGDYSAVQPVITLADPTTFVTPASGETADFSDSFISHPYVVCDYINKVTYNVTLKHPTDLDKIYVPGEWVNIYDMQGTKVMTTNEDVHHLALPRGVYIIQTESQSFRIFR